MTGGANAQGELFEGQALDPCGAELQFQSVVQPCHRDGGDVGDAGQECREFIAAQPIGGIFRTKCILQCRGHLPQHQVADVMSEEIVDLFEAVDVGDQQGEAQAMALRIHRPSARDQQRRRGGCRDR